MHAVSCKHLYVLSSKWVRCLSLHIVEVDFNSKCSECINAQKPIQFYVCALSVIHNILKLTKKNM